MVPTLITSFVPTLLPPPFSLKGGCNGYKQFQIEIGYLVLLVSTCQSHHIEKSISFNMFCVTNQKKDTFNIFVEKELAIENPINRYKVVFEASS